VALFEITKAAAIINETAHEDAQVIWGHTFNEEAGNMIRITVIATGFSEVGDRVPPPLPKPGGDRRHPSLRVRSLSTFSFDEGDLQPTDSGEDMFIGMPKTTYDTPAIFRKKQK
jgi:cell division protein FtsZ